MPGFAIVTGASSGIGLELAKGCASRGYDLLIAADEPAIESAARALRRWGGEVIALECDLSREKGVEELLFLVAGKPVDLLLANAGRGLGRGFVEQEWRDIRKVIDTNITGTFYLTHQIAGKMVEEGRGRILLTGSIAGAMPGPFQAVYNASKACINSFAIALRNELAGTGVSVTALLHGVTDTHFFFDRAGLLDTKIGRDEKMAPGEVAAEALEALMAGREQIVVGWKNKLQVAAAHVVPVSILAQQHRKLAQPDTSSEGGEARGKH